MVRFARLVTLIAALCLSTPLLFTAATDDDAIRSVSSALRAKNYQQALELAQKARREWPKDVRIVVLEGMALKGLGRESEALTRFESALQISPDYVPALEAASEIEYKTGSAAATTRLERLLTLRPNEETAHAMLAVLAWKRGDCATAVKHFGESKSAIAVQPDAQYGFGACLMRLKRTQEALAVFDRLVAAHPDDRRTRYALAVLLLDARRTREAIDALDPLVDAKDPDPTALELSSAAYESLGDTPKAVALLREAIVRDPGNVKLYLDFASLSFAHQSFQVGIDMINVGL
jgi:tetratricopeptide (TPR) repeat protein